MTTTADARPAVSAGGRRSRTSAGKVLRAAAYVVAVLVIWQGYVTFAEVPNYLLPGPIDVGKSILDLVVTGELWPHLAYTSRNILFGLLVGTVVGCLLGWLLASSARLRMVLTPYVVILQAAPKIALAPLLVLWFGLGIGSQLTLIILLAFFPMMIAVTLGFAEVTDDQRSLGKILDLGRMRFFRMVQLPAALPAIFSGLRIAVIDAMTGAFLAEYISAQKGLGYLMVLGRSTYETSLLMAAVFLTVLVGLGGFALVGVIERKSMPWR